MLKKQIFLIMFLSIIWVFSGYFAQAQDNEKDLIIKVAQDKTDSFYSQTMFRAGEITFQIKPLLDTKSRFCKNWFIARPDSKTELSSWDLAHYIVANDQNVIYAEPDQSHIESYYDNQGKPSRGCETSQYSKDWPYPEQGPLLWNFEDGYTQLKSARGQDTSDKVRIAHLDTGYDPSHLSTPKYLCSNLQRNFIDGENEYSAVDIGSEGLLNQPGHGTSTLCILAGNKVSIPEYGFNDYIGGAPFAEVVPIRLSKSVILYKSSAFVKALYYIMDTNVHCEVLSMSMGGVASEYWAEAVNDAYENGVVMVTAAGNNFGRLPTTNTVFPARFKRVISACGVAYDNTPYFKFPLFDFRMQGNFGPQEVMNSAIAAYTPNILWAKMGCISKFDLDGGGTSAATPQVAAAAALWLQKYHSQVYTYPWQRVNAVRYALFNSARKDLSESQKYYGNGVLKAYDALKIPPKLDTTPIEKDEVSFPIWTILFGSRYDINSEVRKMFEVELLRLEHNSLPLQDVFSKIKENQSITQEQKQKIKDTISAIPYTSDSLLGLIEQLR